MQIYINAQFDLKLTSVSQELIFFSVLLTNPGYQEKYEPKYEVIFMTSPVFNMNPFSNKYSILNRQAI